MKKFTPFKIGELVVESPFIAGPMVHLSHFALRNTLSSFSSVGSGAGLFFTEMLDARKVLTESFENSPWLKRTLGAPTLFQLLLCFQILWQ